MSIALHNIPIRIKMMQSLLKEKPVAGCNWKQIIAQNCCSLCKDKLPSLPVPYPWNTTDFLSPNAFPVLTHLAGNEIVLKSDIILTETHSLLTLAFPYLQSLYELGKNKEKNQSCVCCLEELLVRQRLWREIQHDWVWKQNCDAILEQQEQIDGKKERKKERRSAFVLVRSNPKITILVSWRMR